MKHKYLLLLVNHAKYADNFKHKGLYFRSKAKVREAIKRFNRYGCAALKLRKANEPCEYRWRGREYIYLWS